jgi:uncharacterized protein DUF2442
MRDQRTIKPAIRIRSLSFTASFLIARLSDGRIVRHPLKWYPRLLKASVKDLKDFEISGGGYAVHWETLDEDLSAKGIADGLPSLEYRTRAR